MVLASIGECVNIYDTPCSQGHLTIFVFQEWCNFKLRWRAAVYSQDCNLCIDTQLALAASSVSLLFCTFYLISVCFISTGWILRIQLLGTVHSLHHCSFSCIYISWHSLNASVVSNTLIQVIMYYWTNLLHQLKLLLQQLMPRVTQHVLVLEHCSIHRVNRRVGELDITWLTVLVRTIFTSEYTRADVTWPVIVFAWYGVGNCTSNMQEEQQGRDLEEMDHLNIGRKECSKNGDSFIYILHI